MRARVWAAVAAALATPAAAAETIVSIPGGRAPLYGTLERPAAATSAGPAALILAGSGPTDRDGNSGLGLAPNSLKQLADALADAGIASLRFDKRGIGASAAAAPPEGELRLATYGDDVVAWTEWLRGQAGVRCVVLVGHSEGALIALLAAQKTAVCGVVSLEGPGRPLAVVLKEQLSRALAGPMRAEAIRIVDELAAGQSVATPPPELAALFRPSVQPYLISELTVDPAGEARKVKAPLLLVEGDQDRQVTLDDFHALAAARTDAHAVVIPGMIHFLKTAPSEGQTPGSLTNLPLSAGLADAVAAFIRGL